MIYHPIEELFTQDLILRRICPDDLNPLFEVSSDPEVTRYMLFHPHESLAQTQQSIDQSIQCYHEGNYYRWGIAQKKNNELVGMIQLLRFDEDTGTCSFAYMIGKRFWGNGYGTQALSAVMEFAFAKMNVKCIIADHFSENKASGAVMQKCGMKHIGSIPARYEKNGISHNAEEYRIYESEWKN